ncbi:hypothetical protein E3P92_02377 [Wallemia ichthyophaga]|nr:hypothetical protein E3P95_01942 [Wallemia ichthyophaga]TIB00781.1 hypothetical protein E3P94_02066 [Wallemia ichthyophaga]TIB13162.1 hypothetical protein E3P92_02377 [Wallemia ichthyophaga]TIB33862.1 hypothetical protein E3P84_02008 [Wallemia ichthyophaga]TIB41496.1 hypothetical protein E3P83_01960 [Wallemia ichthyophaga]
MSKHSKNGSIPQKPCIPDRLYPQSVKIVAWNIVSYQSILKKGFDRYIKAEKPDILILCETKTHEAPGNLLLRAQFPYQSWSNSLKKGYAGCAILSKVKPIKKWLTLPMHPDPPSTKGRIVTLEFESSFLIGTYVPNSGMMEDKGLRQQWDDALFEWITQLEETKPVIWGGDLNTTPVPRDMHSGGGTWGLSAGTTLPERRSLKKILNDETVMKDIVDAKLSHDRRKHFDAWRQLHGWEEEGEFTFYSMKIGGRGAGVGWRLDTFIVDERLIDKVAGK